MLGEINAELVCSFVLYFRLSSTWLSRLMSSCHAVAVKDVKLVVIVVIAVDVL